MKKLFPLIRHIIFFFILFPVTAFSQLCNGSLGDPIINIDFGAGTNPGTALGSGVNNYNFIGVCPGDGYYTIANSSADCFNNSWHFLSQDHTPGDANGYMMIVNASYSPGDFYVKTVSGLCSGTTYEFASWILNIERATACNANPIKPNVTFKIETIDGNVLMTHNTGDIPSTNSPDWKQYGHYFTTPNNVTSVVIRMTNNASGGCGNDLVLDDITFRPCGAKLSATLNDAATEQSVCDGDSKIFTLTSNISGSYNIPAYQWQISTDKGINWNDIPAANSLTYVRQPTSKGTYWYRLVAAEATNIFSPNCRVASNSISITVHPLPDVKAQSNNPTCEGDTLRLNVAVSGTYAWTGPNGFNSTIQHPVINSIKNNNNGSYCVTLTSSAGCVNTDCVTVQVLDLPIANAGDDISICEGASTTLQGTRTGSSLSWTPTSGLSNANASTPTASPSDTTEYILSVANGACKSVDTMTVYVWKKPIANAGSDKQMLQGSSVQLNASSSGSDVSLPWSPEYRIASATSLNPIVSPETDTTYTLTVVSNNGCGSNTDKVFVRVYRKIIVPNAFSPNNDGINDTWSIAMLNTYSDADVSVFNRYGQLVYHSTGYAKEWDGTQNGKPLAVGTYYYVIKTKSVFGNFSGWVMILR